jgi:hypothetical protein
MFIHDPYPDPPALLYPPYQSSPSSISSEDNTSSSATPPPFYPDQPPPYPDCDKKPVAPSRLNIAHPYARLYAKKDGAKRRKIWNHALEKSLFTPNELSVLPPFVLSTPFTYIISRSLMGAPHRRTIYMASLEAHVDRLHAQMIELGYFPIDFNQLEPFKGLNSKTAKVSSCQNIPSGIVSADDAEYGRRSPARHFPYKTEAPGTRTLGNTSPC